MKFELAWMRFMGMSNASKKMGINKHPAVVQVELQLQRDFLKHFKAIKNGHIN